MATFGRTKYRAAKNRKTQADTDDPFDKVTVHIPRALLREIVRIKGGFKVEDDIDISTMICIALDNEMQAQNPFDPTYDVTSIEPGMPLAYADEAGKIMAFLRGFPKGCTIQTLFHCRWNYGIPDLRYMRQGLRELIEKDLVEFFELQYPRPSKRIRLKGVLPQELKAARYRRMKGVSLAGVHSILDREKEVTDGKKD